jgi:hypothetical protein
VYYYFSNTTVHAVCITGHGLVLSHGLCSLIVNQWATGIMGFADESELAQSKHDPPTEPIITDPVLSLLKNDWGKTRQTAKMRAVLRHLTRVSHSLAALIIMWLRGVWYLWRGKATYGQAVSSTTYMPRVRRFYSFIFNWIMHRYCFARTVFQETNALCRMKQVWVGLQRHVSWLLLK